MAIIDFHDKETHIIWEGKEFDKKANKQLDVSKWDKARKVMQALHRARSLKDVRQYRPDHKSGEFEGLTSLDIDDQHRVLFKWEDGDADEVFAGDPDYH